LSVKARTELSGGILGVESVKGNGTTVRASWSLPGNS
jgi:signal transduction histidine kinase